MQLVGWTAAAMSRSLRYACASELAYVRMRDSCLLRDARPPACPPALPRSSGRVCQRVRAYASESGCPRAPAVQQSVRPRARASTSGCRQPPQLTTPRPGDRTRRGSCWYRINCVYGAASAAPSPEVQPGSKWKPGAADNSEN